MQRNGNNPTTPEMDNLSYRYKTQSAGTATRRSNNMLLSYSDLQAYESRYSDDLDGYGLAFDADDPGTWCYKYDEIGNLIQDKSEQIAGIEWDAYGKIKTITREKNSTKPDLEFIYDPMGTRVGKIEKPRNALGVENEDQWIYTWYTLDAQGQTLATHRMTYEVAGTRYKAVYRGEEKYLFGSSRLGSVIMSQLPEKEREFNYSGYHEDGRFNITSWVMESISTETICQSHCVEEHKACIGDRRYELKDHLGNVWATVSDMKIYSGGNFVAEIKSAQTYYPFGSLQPGRSFNAGDYRFGFNGKENDNEVKGTGNSVDFGARIYDSRLGRWLSTDPLQSKKPGWSPYEAFLNNAILYKDPDGRDEYVTIVINNEKTGKTTTMTVVNDGKVMCGRIEMAASSTGNGVWADRAVYYNYQTTMTVNISKSGSSTFDIKSTPLTESTVQDVDYFGGKYGDVKDLTPTTNYKGGIMFTSNKLGAGTLKDKISIYPVDVINIDDLMGVIAAAGRTTGGKNMENIAESVGYLWAQLETGMDFTEAVQGVIEKVTPKSKDETDESKEKSVGFYYHSKNPPNWNSYKSSTKKDSAKTSDSLRQNNNVIDQTTQEQ